MPKYGLPKKALFRNFELKTNKKYCKKVSFATQEDADYYINKLQKTSTRDKVPINSYLCVKCNCWHLTSWEQVDLNKFTEDTNAELKEVFDEYDKACNIFLKNSELLLTQLDKALSDRNNALLENRVLKKEVEKLKAKLNT